MQFKQDDANIEEVIATYRLAGIHPAADLFPMIEDEEKFSELCESVNQHGVEIPIILTHDNYLLDGRNRLKACFLTGQVPRWDKKSDLYKDDYVGLALRLNKDRRHLSASQLAALAVDLEAIYAAEAKERQRESGEQYGRGEKVEARLPQPLESKTLPQARDLAAQQVGASPRYVQEAKKIKQESPVIFEQLKKGATNIPQAKKAIAELKVISKPYITLSQWEKDGLTEVPAPSSDTTFNRQSDNAEDSMGNIEWASWSWNPVTGCKHDCSYCYARDIANRFYSQGFEPTIHPDRLTAPYTTKLPKDADTNPAARNVFANSMSDLYGRWVPQEWIDAVFKAMSENPQWNFLTLTKFPKRAAELVYPKNVWIGTSVDLQSRVKSAEDAFEKINCGVRWLSIEPMIEPLKFSRPQLFDWVVIGGASKSNQTPAWTPPFEWVVRVASQFLDSNPDVKIYLKTNGRPREFPGVITQNSAPEAFYYLKKTA
jgi:protein gp37/ParB-like chromosome segregation protein Spo0J